MEAINLNYFQVGSFFMCQKGHLKVNSVYSRQAIFPQRGVGKYGFDEIYNLQ